MADTLYVQKNFSELPSLNFVVEQRASDPTTPANGRLWYHTGTNLAKVWINGAAVRFGIANIVNAEIDAAAAIAESKLALATDAAAGTGSRRTLGFTSTQAAPGNARLDQFAAPTSAVSMGGQRITNGADPSSATDFTTQQWVQNLVDSRVNGQDWKTGARVRKSTNTTISNPGTAVFDGVTLANGESILLTGQTAPAENGIYVFNGSAVAMTRRTDADTSAEVTRGMTVPVEEGTSAGTIWLLTAAGSSAIVLGTTSLVFTQIGAAGATYTASTGITLVGNDFQLVVPVTAANGGTNATSFAVARDASHLNVPQRGTTAAVGAISAGGTVTTPNSFGTKSVQVQLQDTTTGKIVDASSIDITVATSTITIGSDIAVSASALTCIIQPIA